jgi:hypothetical protein
MTPLTRKDLSAFDVNSDLGIKKLNDEWRRVRIRDRLLNEGPTDAVVAVVQTMLPESEREAAKVLLQKTARKIENNVKWSDIGNFDTKRMDGERTFIIDARIFVTVGLEDAKMTILNSVVGPILNPKVFQHPLKGMLLYGPPGTGKVSKKKECTICVFVLTLLLRKKQTFISKATAAESKATFFYIDEASIKSEKHSETEKFINGVFDLARLLQPSVIFIDEADSLLRSPHQSDHPDIRAVFEKVDIQQNVPLIDDSGFISTFFVSIRKWMASIRVHQIECLLLVPQMNRGVWRKRF